MTAYSTAIDWAGKVVEKLTGETLETYMRKNLWDPLGIKNITFWVDQNPEMKARLAGMSARDPSSGKVVPFDQQLMNAGRGDCMGGQGSYADLTEYIKILHSILVDDGKLLKPETTAQMFQPQLTKASKAAQKHVLGIPEVAGLFVGDFPNNVEYDWGLAGMLIQGDNEGRRKKGTLVWSGLPNLFWVSQLNSTCCSDRLRLLVH